VTVRWLLIVLVACGGAARIDSERVGAGAPVAALAVVSDLGARGELDGAAFAQALGACTAPGEAKLIVTWAGSAQDRRGTVRSMHYRATVTVAGQLRWRAELALTVDARGSTERAAAQLARELIARLVSDQVLSACANGVPRDAAWRDDGLRVRAPAQIAHAARVAHCRCATRDDG
jgi:hypothetical protein